MTHNPNLRGKSDEFAVNMLTEQHVTEFIEAYEKDFGVTLTREETAKKAIALKSFLRVVMRNIPKGDYQAASREDGSGGSSGTT